MAHLPGQESLGTKLGGYANFLLEAPSFIPIVGGVYDYGRAAFNANGAGMLMAVGSISADILSGGTVGTALRVEIKAGGKLAAGATLDKLSTAEILMIQNAADKSGQTITLVGSRVDPNKDLHARSDYDYIIQENNKVRSDLKGSLPGAKNVRNGQESMLDIFNIPINPALPHVIFTPKK
ncbi:hypothetical protein O0881_21080 [Janthinobacterium sp. SUN100]|uniref:hypothetical protein n=1 Tax=Janthinobacterium sp. SUN100 TaxID=3004101 RepID=UPI0025B046AC|nr:hypothetical protein [Janthinobacterium sp. SUN100]MDN2704478.1 hypothetical protein [Janthinobacterium sp. SUN100]